MPKLNGRVMDRFIPNIGLFLFFLTFSQLEKSKMAILILIKKWLVGEMEVKKTTRRQNGDPPLCLFVTVINPFTLNFVIQRKTLCM